MKFLKNSSPEDVAIVVTFTFIMILIWSPIVLLPLGRIIEDHNENQRYENDRKEYKNCVEKVPDPNYIREYCHFIIHR